MPTFCNRFSKGGTALVYDGDVVAREDVTNANARIANASNQVSALLDLDSLLIRGIEQSSGNLTINKVYEITATTADYFGTGLIVGNLFAASSALALSSSNKVKEVLGNHLVQTNTSYMPLLNNRYNMLTYSEDFSNAIWLKSNCTVTSNAVNSPIDTLTADAIIDNATSNIHRIRCSLPASTHSIIGSAYSLTVNVKYNGIRYVYINLDASCGAKLCVDLLSGAYVSGGISIRNISVIDYNGFYKVSFSCTGRGITDNLYFQLNKTNSSASDETYMGDGASGVYIWGAQFEQSNFAGNYQRINAATDFDTVGFPYYARLDGSNDMQSSAFTLNQPCSIYTVFKQTSFTAGDYLCDGYTSGSLQCSQVTSAGKLSIGSGGTSFNNTSKSSIGTYDIMCNVYNGASSSSKINNLTKVTGTVGAVNAAGFVLGSKSTPSDYGNLEVKEIIIRNGADSDLMQSAIMNYLYYKHNITY